MWHLLKMVTVIDSVVRDLPKGKCPRCGNESTELGTPVINVGKTRKMRVSFQQCPKCFLVYYEGIE